MLARSLGAIASIGTGANQSNGQIGCSPVPRYDNAADAKPAAITRITRISENLAMVVVLLFKIPDLITLRYADCLPRRYNSLFLRTSPSAAALRNVAYFTPALAKSSAPGMLPRR